jgi:hypothetical protein
LTEIAGSTKLLQPEAQHREQTALAEARPFRIAVPDERLATIRRQVREFPWDAIPELVEQGDAWSAGAGLSFMRELCDYWVGGFDWRAQEAAINRFPQFMVRIGEQDIHVLHERGSGAHDVAPGADTWLAGLDRGVRACDRPVRTS